MIQPPIGSVCLYFGDVAFVSGAPNPAWEQGDNAHAQRKPSAARDDTGNATTATAGAQALLEAQGWMVCDGRVLWVSAFPHLYAALGTLYGGDEAAGVFHLPDLRGIFVRGVDHGAGADPDIDQRRRPDGSGDYAGVGSMQFDAFQVHQHDYNEPQGTAVSDKGSPAYNIAPTQTPTSDPLPPARTSPNETRPRNIAAYYIIRYA